MIELFVITRVIVDYFWEYKYLSIIHTLLFLFLAILLLLKTKKRIKPCNTDRVFTLFTVFTFIILLYSESNLALLDFIKLFSYFLFYFIGRIFPPKIKYPHALSLFATTCLTLLTFLALSGKGYQYWGDVMTYTGGYYFKTDLAISSLILLTLCFACTTRKSVLFIAITLTIYLVFKSNARIALPLVAIMPAIILYIKSASAIRIQIKTIAPLIALSLLGISIFNFINFEELGMLSFDLSNPFSASNTQGRSVIWSALLQAYSESGFIDKAIGLGLGYDSTATRLFSESSSLEGVRAHNSFLYLLICFGALGSLIFYTLIYSISSKIPITLRCLKLQNHAHEIPTLACAFVILFFWLSMTTEIIIRPQLMSLLFFFSGILVQSYMKVTEKTRN